MKQREKIITAITAALLLVIVVVILAVTGVYTEGFKHKFSHFYVSAGGSKYMTSSDVVLGNVRFDVCYVLKENTGYTVKVVPAGDAVTYQVGGRSLEYTSELSDVTAAFDIQKDEKGFVIQCRQKTLQGVLETMYGGAEVKIISDNVDTVPHFKLVVTSGDGSASVELTFRCFISVEDVDIDPPDLLL